MKIKADSCANPCNNSKCLYISHKPEFHSQWLLAINSEELSLLSKSLERKAVEGSNEESKQSGKVIIHEDFWLCLAIFLEIVLLLTKWTSQNAQETTLTNNTEAQIELGGSRKGPFHSQPPRWYLRTRYPRDWDWRIKATSQLTYFPPPWCSRQWVGFTFMGFSCGCAEAISGVAN